QAMQHVVFLPGCSPHRASAECGNTAPALRFAPCGLQPINSSGSSLQHKTATRHDTSAPLAVRPLSPALGAEISGIDLRDPIDAARAQALLDAWHRHLVILMRGQILDEDAQVRFAQTFGPPAKVSSGRRYSDKHPSVMLVSNIRKDGKPIGALPDGEMHFHTDQCHQEMPAKATTLYAIEVPAQGGNTLFANAYAAYETLPAELQRLLAGRRPLNAYQT